MNSYGELPSAPDGAFKKTHWSLVLRARDLNSADGQQAMATLCQDYYLPVYAFIRRKGNERESARDLTQEFFYRLLAKEFLQNVDREKGKFRTFLLTAVQRFLCNEWERAHAQKRVWDTIAISWDHELAENEYLKQPADNCSPEKLYDRRWAVTLLEGALKDLEEEYARAGKADLFRAFQSFIVGEAAHGDYAAAAASLGLTDVNARQCVLRMRRRYGERLRERIAETVETTDAVEEELRSLYAALSG